MSRRNEILECARNMMKGGAVQLKAFKMNKKRDFHHVISPNHKMLILSSTVFVMYDVQYLLS